MKGDVDIIVNGKTYTRGVGDDGLAKLNINLGKGEYDITANFKGNDIYLPSNVTNKITVNDDSKPQKLYDYITETGGGKLGQRTGYTCGPHSLV